jgi:hypothetical protein
MSLLHVVLAAYMQLAYAGNLRSLVRHRDGEARRCTHPLGASLQRLGPPNHPPRKHFSLESKNLTVRS